MSENLESLKYLPTNFRRYLGNSFNRILTQSDEEFVRCYDYNMRQSLVNSMYCAKWASGFVYDVHNTFLSSGIGTEIITKLTDKITGGGVFLEGDEHILSELSQYLDTQKLIVVLKQLFAYTLSRGAALLKVDLKNKKYPKLNVCGLGRFDIKLMDEEKILDILVFIEEIPSKKRNERYMLCEHRYFKNDIPCIIYSVLKINWQIDNIYDKSIQKLELKGKDIPAYLKEKYKEINFNKEEQLPFFNSLGVHLVNNTEYNSKFPYSIYGESQLVNVLDLLYAYDHALTAKENDKYLGRGRTLIPQIMQQTTRALAPSININNMCTPTQMLGNKAPLDKTFFTVIPSLSIEKQTPINVQFNLRTLEWREELNGLKGDIAAGCGISASMLDARLTGGVEKTAREISAEENLTTSTIQSKRSLALNSINNALKDFIKALNYVGIVYIRFSMAGLTNTSILYETTIQAYNSGLLSLEQAIKTLHPDWKQDEIEEEIERIQLQDNQLSENEVINNIGSNI